MSEDKKLSTAARKKLPGKAFCGPGRSFPAHDCAHVRAGFRLLNRAKVSESTRSSIRSCLSRRNKSMGCGVNSDNDEELDKIIDSEAFEETKEFIQFLEELESQTRSIADNSALKQRMIRHILTLRKNRLGIDHTEDQYIQRGVDSLLDTLLDELEEIN